MKENGTTLQITKLKKQRAEVLEELAHLRKEATSEVDGDVGQGDPKLVERELARSLVEVHERKLAEIEQALAEAGRGMYGICERCGKPIDPERLEVIPETTFCIKCKQTIERQGHK